MPKKRFVQTYTVALTSHLQQQILHWLNSYDICCLLSSNNQTLPYSQVSFLAAGGAYKTQEAVHLHAPTINQFLADEPDWVFGNIAFNTAYATQPNYAEKHKLDEFKNLALFKPEVVVHWQQNILTIESIQDNTEAIWQAIQAIVLKDELNLTSPFQPLVSIQQYKQQFQTIQRHLQQGNCYEINYCIPWQAQYQQLDIPALWHQLVQASPTPFSAFYKWHSQYCVCASPERFFQLQNDTIITQPIKGTQKRGTTTTEDAALLQELQHSLKNKSENVMIVDLMRNDMSPLCQRGTVHVPELFAITAYEQVFQMHSTIQGTLLPHKKLGHVLEALFPMGSMTGAPKKRVLEITHEVETQQRGLYSGSIGYWNPQGISDWNVVIRSIIINTDTKTASYQVGSGITVYSEANEEYEECLLKAKAIQQIWNRL